MKFLRTAPTGRLLAMLAALVVIIAGGSAIAVAATGGGPVPKPRSLASAVHRALGAKPVKGISANITFTNNLIDASSFQGTDPLLQGASGRLWLSNDHRLRLELQSSSGDAQIVVNKTRFWISDPAQQTVYEGTLPSELMGADKTKAKAGSAKPGHEGIPSIATIQTDINKLLGHVDLSRAIPGDVAGQAAYTVRVSPRHDGGLLGAAEVAWDAARGVPLRFALYAKGNPNPILALAATGISYGAIPASDFNVAPPRGAKIVKISGASVAGQAKATKGQATKGKATRHARRTEVTGIRAVAKKLPFTLHAPGTLVAMPRQSVKLLSWGKHPAALLTYGKGLGGIAVIEQSAPAKAGASSVQSSSSDGHGFSLPTVSINGATGTELDTALGTVIHFTQGGVSYTVLGSVPPVAAEKAARSL
jgi:outer membrane lipoprotein-sorting protein